MLVLDTSALSAVMHDIEPAKERLRKLEPGDVILAAPVAAEIHYGLARLESGSKRRRLLEEAYRLVRRTIRFLDWNEPAVEEFGRLKAELERRGAKLDDFDLAIASVAMSFGADVATMNVRHFARIEGLVVEDWSA